MTDQSVSPKEPDVMHVALRARSAARQLTRLSDEQRRTALETAAESFYERRTEIVNANEVDTRAAQQTVAAGTMTQALLDRLKTSEQGVAEMAAKIRQVASLPDPLNRTLASTELDDGLILEKVSCPLGVVAVIFESRPDVIPQVGALALRSGNAVLFKGGAEAAHTNDVLMSIWRDALHRFVEIPTDAFNLLHTRDEVSALLTLDQYVDLIVPRGSQQFVRYIAEHSRIPVLGHGEGICHVYVDCQADLKKAIEITLDSKVQYPAACNAAETLLVHEAVASQFLPTIVAELRNMNVEVRGCPRSIAAVPGLVCAEENDWSTEYSDLIISLKVVSSLVEAVEHINTYGSGHTEAIVTEDNQAVVRFMNEVDAAGVFHNASTRFADGFRYGFGAEVGISTSKLHARGPVGLEGLTTYKYKLFGHGHQVAEYASGKRSFKHEASS